MLSRCRIHLLLIFALAIPLLGPGAPGEAAAADVIKFEVDFFEDGSEEPVNHATIWTSERKVRVDQMRPGQGADGSSLVYRGDQDLVISISDKTRSYVTVERRMLSMVEGRVRAGRRTVQRHLDGLPGDQRKGLETLLGVAREDPNAITRPIVVKAMPPSADRLDEVAGFACTAKSMQRGSVIVGAACVADWDRIGMQPEDMEVFRSLANFQRDALGVKQVTPLEIVPNQPLDLIVQFGGIPLSFERQIGERMRSAVKVTSVDWVRDEAGALFEVPATYTATNGFTAIMSHLAGTGLAPAKPAAEALLDGSSEIARASGPADAGASAPPASPAPSSPPPAAPAPAPSMHSEASAAIPVAVPVEESVAAAQVQRPAAKAAYSGREALRRVRERQGAGVAVPRTVGATRDRKAPVRLFPNR